MVVFYEGRFYANSHYTHRVSQGDRAGFYNSEAGKVFWEDGSKLEEKREVLHFSHAFNGGVKINETAESTVPGLFAVGETAAGPHGADRIHSPGSQNHTGSQGYFRIGASGNYVAAHEIPPSGG